jgi:hypothetical protein
MANEAENKNTPELRRRGKAAGDKSNQPAKTSEQAAEPASELDPAALGKALAYAYAGVQAALKGFCEAAAGPREPPVYVVSLPGKRARQPQKRRTAGAARLPGGRPREYDRDAIAKIAEDLLGIDDHLERFLGRVRQGCKEHRPPIKAPKPTLLTKICRPIFLRRKDAK